MMTERDDKNVGAYSFKVEPFHADFKGRLTLGVLGNYLLNCAGFHAAERGCLRTVILNFWIRQGIQSVMCVRFGP